MSWLRGRSWDSHSRRKNNRFAAPPVDALSGTAGSHHRRDQLSAGVGLFYDATPLFLIARPLAGQRIDYFFDANGNPNSGPVTMTFSLTPNALEAPRFLN